MNSATKSRVGRPARIAREDVSKAALAIGFDKVTVKAIGQHLGVDHSSLYRHVKSRNDILIAAADMAFSTIEMPELSTGGLLLKHWRIVSGNYMNVIRAWLI